MITKKEALEKVGQHFIVEGNPLAMSLEDSLCRYKTENGNRCAIGILVPEWFDAHPEVVRDNEAFSELALKKEFAEMFEDPQSEFWDDLQTWHDSGFSAKKEPILDAYGKYLGRKGNQPLQS